MIKKLFLLLFLLNSLFGESLNSIIDYAIKNSITIKKIRTDIQESKLKRDETKSSSYGEINLVGAYTHYNSPRTLAPLTPSSMMGGLPVTTTKDIYSVGIAYSVPLFTGYATTRQIEMDSIAKKMAEVKLNLTLQQLVYNIKTIYLTILKTKELLKAQEDYTKALKSLSRQINDEVRLGKKAKIDLLKSQVDIQASKTRENSLKSNINILKVTLEALVGKEIMSFDSIEISMKKIDYNSEKLYKSISKLNKIKIDNLAIKKADKAILKSEALKYPMLSLNSYVGRNYGEDRGLNGWDNETLIQVELNVKYTIFDFGKSDIATQKAKISKIRALLNKEQNILNLKRDIKKAIQQINESYSAYLGNKSEYELSKKSEEIESVRYKNGVSTLNDLLLAKAKSEFARAKSVQSRYDYQKNIYYLEYLLEKGNR